jgi:dsDNA-specific endonuclease/ATPase MutS2
MLASMVDEREEAMGDEPVEIPIEECLDLHYFAPRDILDVVEAYLEAAAGKGFREVRLIHGKGIGFQRERVRELLSRHPLVEEYRDAAASRGHWGATVVKLRQA